MRLRERLLRLTYAVLFGVAGALTYHLLHAATEPDAYSDLRHILFHLGVEAMIAIYGTVFALAVQGIAARLRARRD